MSINLHVKSYCENCPNFKAGTHSSILKAVFENLNIHDIYCVNQDHCLVLMRHLEQQFEEKHSKVEAAYKILVDMDIPETNEVIGLLGEVLEE